MNRDQLARDHLALADTRARFLAPALGLPVDEARSAALLGLAQAIDRYSPEGGPFGPFCRVIIDRRLTDTAREWHWRHRCAPIEGRSLGDHEQLLELVPDDLATTDLSDARVDVVRALGALTPTERKVVLLHGKMGHTFADTAGMLALTPAQTQAAWYRALRRMRRVLDPSAAASGPSGDTPDGSAALAA